MQRPGKRSVRITCNRFENLLCGDLVVCCVWMSVCQHVQHNHISSCQKAYNLRAPFSHTFTHMLGPSEPFRMSMKCGKHTQAQHANTKQVVC